MLKNSIFRIARNLVPKISSTEIIALKSGTTSIDREILQGKIEKKNEIIDKKYKFDNNLIDQLTKNYKDDLVFPSNKTNEIFEFLGKNKFFSFIIKEKYDGLNLSVKETSSILTKITSINPALGVTVMVPNSLGPGELLQNYGTKNQKDKYLKSLANGDFIPCFGLTGPNNGSDATGSIDHGGYFRRR